MLRSLRDLLALGLLLALGPMATADMVFVSTVVQTGLGHDSITMFNAPNNSSIFTLSGLNHRVGLAFDAAGNLFVANQGNNSIEKFTPEGIGTGFASGGGLSRQRGHVGYPRFIVLPAPAAAELLR